MTEKRLWARISAGHTDKKTKRLRVRKRESLSLLSLLTLQAQAFPSGFLSCSTGGAALSPQAAPSSISSGPASPAFFARLRTPYHLKIFNRARTRPSPFLFPALPLRAKRFKHNTSRRLCGTLRILLAHVIPLEIASSVFQAFQAF